jgi:XTP/dITP diphosphohydrolase
VNRLVVATTNPGKIHEIRLAMQSLDGWSVEAIPAGIPDIEETGSTFLENAILKAVHYSREVDSLTVADDSGLAVDALDGRPGVHSARYGPTAEARNQRLLAEMIKTRDANRHARFFCALAVAQNGKLLWTTEGRLDGEIARTPTGSQGFGYDPVFRISALGKTMAELNAEEKNRISARGQALAALRTFLANR